ncbi:MAG: hypothetical protein GX592_08300 [Clostridiales bacterium]|nr:hypothetical protein [Clostridiales bacterium]
MRITPLEALQSLPYMFKGMLGIFVVIGVIYAVIAILNATTGKGRKTEE